MLKRFSNQFSLFSSLENMVFPDLTIYFFVILATSVDTFLLCVLNSWAQVNNPCWNNRHLVLLNTQEIMACLFGKTGCLRWAFGFYAHWHTPLLAVTACAAKIMDCLLYFNVTVTTFHK